MVTMFSNFKDVFSLISRKLQRQCAFTHIVQPSKYDSTYGTKISICLKKSGVSEQEPMYLHTCDIQDIYSE